MDDDPLAARLRAAGCVFAEEEAALLRAEAPDAVTLAAWVERRAAGEPLEPLLGWAGFAGLRIPAVPGVFVPRQRSLLLVDLAVGHLRGHDPGDPDDPGDPGHPGEVVLDLCCGSGAIGAAVLARRPGVDLWSGDLDPAAVACARRHLPADRTLLGDLFEPFPAHLRGTVAVVVCNAPYVPTAQLASLPPEARDHEPRAALDGGPDGHTVHRRVAAEAGAWLRPGGSLLVECARTQADGLLALMEAGGLSATVEHSDVATVIRGIRGVRGVRGTPTD